MAPVIVSGITSVITSVRFLRAVSLGLLCFGILAALNAGELSVERVTSGSGISESHPGDSAFDGNGLTGTRFAAGALQGDITVFFAEPVRVDTISIEGSFPPGADFLIEYFAEGRFQPFFSSVKTDLSAANPAVVDLSFDQVSAEKLRLRFSGSALDSAEITEIVIHGTSRRRINGFIRPSSVRVSDNIAWYSDALNLIDGYVESEWIASASDSPMETEDPELFEFLKIRKTGRAVSRAHRGAEDTRRAPPEAGDFEAAAEFDFSGDADVKHIWIYFSEYSSGTYSIEAFDGTRWNWITSIKNPEAGWIHTPLDSSESPKRVRLTNQVNFGELTWGHVGEVAFRAAGEAVRYEAIIEYNAAAPSRDFTFDAPARHFAGAAADLEIILPRSAPPAGEDKNSRTPGGYPKDTLDILVNGHARSAFLTALTPGAGIYSWRVDSSVREGRNFLSFVEENLNPLSIRYRESGRTGELRPSGDSLGDRFTFTPSLFDGEEDYSLGGRVMDADEIEVRLAGPGALSVQGYSEIERNWIPLAAASSSADALLYRGIPGLSAIRLSGTPAAPSEIIIRGLPARGGAPAVSILYPRDGDIMSRYTGGSDFLMARAFGDIVSASINGITVPVYRGIITHPLNRILEAGANREVVVSVLDSRGRRASARIRVTMLEQGFGLHVEGSEELVYTREDEWIVSGQSLERFGRVLVNGQRVRMEEWGIFNHPVSLEEGLNLITVDLVVVDDAVPLDRRIRYVVRLPEELRITVSEPPEGSLVNRSSITVRGRVHGMDEGRITIGGRHAAVRKGDFTVGGVTVSEGKNRITLSTEDSSGRKARAALNIIGDFTPPRISGLSPAPGSWIGTPRPRITGTLIDASPSRVDINGERASMSGGQFTFAASLTEGLNTLVFEARDEAGNSADPISAAYKVDTAAPEPFSVRADPNDWSTDPPRLTFETTDAASGLAGYEIAYLDSPFTPASSPFQMPEMPDGEHTVRVKAVDAAGNSRIAKVQVRIDSEPPPEPREPLAIPGNRENILKWSSNIQDVVSFRISRTPPWRDKTRTVQRDNHHSADSENPLIRRFKYRDRDAVNGRRYSYSIVAVDGPGNQSNAASTEEITTGGGAAPVPENPKPDENTVLRFDELELHVPLSALPENTTAVAASEIISEDLKTMADHPVIGAMYSLSLEKTNPETGKVEEVPHAGFSEHLAAVIEYDPKSLPEGYSEALLRVFYFDWNFGTWIRVKSSYADVQNSRMVFTTSHFSEFSVQATKTPEVSTDELADIDRGNFQTQTAHAPVSISPRGGNVSTSFTEFVLPGRAGLDLELVRSWDLANMRDAGTRSTSDARAKLESFAIASGWRFNFPSIEIGDVIRVRTPGGALHELSSLLPVRTGRFEHRTSDPFTLDIKLKSSGASGSSLTFQRSDSAQTQSRSYTTYDGAVLTASDGRKYHFDKNRLTKITDMAERHAVLFEYNSDNRLKAVTDTFGRRILFSLNKEASGGLRYDITILNDPHQRKISYFIGGSESSPNASRLLNRAVDVGGREWKYDYQSLSYSYRALYDCYTVYEEDEEGSSVSGEQCDFSGYGTTENLFPLTKVSGPGIGTTEIAYRAYPFKKDIVSRNLFYTKETYVLQSSMTADTEILRFAGSGLTRYAQEGSEISTENYAYSFGYKGYEEWRTFGPSAFTGWYLLQSGAVVDDGRLRREYTYSMHQVPSYYWYYRNGPQGAAELQTVSSDTRISVETRLRILNSATGALYETQATSWFPSSELPSHKRTERSGTLWKETLYQYDQWGNTVETKTTSTAEGRTSTREVKTRYYGSDKNTELTLGTPLLKPTKLDNDINHRALPLVRRTTTSWPLPEGTHESRILIENYEYSPRGDRTAYAVKAGDTWRLSRWVFNDSGEVRSRTAPGGQTTTFNYSYPGFTPGTPLPSNALYSVTSSDIDVLTSKGRGETIESQVIRRLHDGSVAGRIDPLGYLTAYTNDALGRTTGIIYPDDNDEPLNIGTAGTPSIPLRPDNPRVNIAYDDTDLTTTVTGTMGETRTYRFDKLGRLTDVIELNRPRDAQGALTAGEADEITTALAYNRYSEITGVTDPNGHTTTYAYDPLGRLSRITYPADGGIPASKRMEMDYAAGVETVIDERSNRIHVTTDLFGNELRREIEMPGDNIVTTAWYDYNGSPVAEIDPMGHTVRHGYNELEERIETRMPRAPMFRGSESYTFAPRYTMNYNAEGNLISRILHTRSGSEETRYTYNGLGWMLSEVRPLENSGSAATRFAYDKAGRVILTTNPVGRTLANTYDSRGRLTRETAGGSYTTTREYDDADRLISRTDPRGNTPGYTGDFTIEYAYDDMDRLILGRMPAPAPGAAKLIVRLAYDPRGNLLRRTEPNGRITDFTYNPRNWNLTQTIRGTGPEGRPAALKTEYRRDPTGNIITITDPGGYRSAQTWDQAGRLTGVIRPSGITTRNEYNLAGQLTALTDGKGRLTRYTYDALNRRVSITDPIGGITRLQYDEAGRLTRSTDQENRTVTARYDKRGLKTQEVGRRGQITTYAYNSAGDLITQTDPLSTLFTYTYNTRGLIESVKAEHPNSAQIPAQMRSYTYDPAGSLITVVDGDGLPALSSQDVLSTFNSASGTYRADPYGLIRSAATTWNGVKRTITYDYNPMHQLTRIRTPSGRGVNYRYDQLGRLASMPGYLRGTISYDKRGQVDELTYANGITRSYSWDADGRLTRLNYSDDSEQLIEEWEFAYDRADNMIKKGSSSYRYDNLDRLTSAVLFDGFEARDIDRIDETIGYVTQDHRGEAPLALAEDDVTLKLDTRAASIGVKLGDIALEVTRILLHPQNEAHRIRRRHLQVFYKPNHRSGYREIPNWSFRSGPQGAIEIRLDRGIRAVSIKVHCRFNELDIEGEGVDAATFFNHGGDIISVTYLTALRHERYRYDGVGNRLSETINQGGSLTSTSIYDEHKDLLMHNGRTGFVYDALGNLIEKGSDYSYDSANNRTTVNPTTADYRRYTYDLFGRMTQVRALGADNTVVLLAEYVYDFRGMRIAKRKGTQITRYDLDEAGRNLEIQEDQGSRTTAWIGQKPLAVQDSGGTSWYVTDHQGTTAMMTDENGKILWEDAANPFGIPAGSRGTVQSGVLFTGKIFDPDADMYYFNARWYNPETGRFASEDPARDGINWYAYVGNNPLKYTDPTGLRRTREERRAAREQRKADRKQKREERKQSSTSVTWDKPSPSSSSESDSSDSDDNSSGGANKEPPEGINTLRDNSRANPPNHGSEDSRKALDASAVGDVKDDIANKLPKGLDTDGASSSEEERALTDIIAPKDASIFAMKEYANVSEYGNYMVLEHSDGKFSVMAHLEEFGEGIEVGDQVKQGDTIAKAGGTGTIENMAAHLHWAVFENVDKLNDQEGDMGIFSGSNWVINKDKSVDPQPLIDSGNYIHPSSGTITSFYGNRDMPFPRNFHEGIDYSIRTRR